MIAHATEYGLVISYRDLGRTDMLALSYEGECQALSGELQDLALEMFERAEQTLPSEIVDVLESANYEGRTTNFPELKDADIAYSVEDAATRFLPETLQFEFKGRMDAITLPGELAGRREVYKSSTVEDADPLTCEEAAELIRALTGEDFSDVDGATLKRSVESYLQPALAEVAARVQTYLEQIDHHNWTLDNPVLTDSGWGPSMTPKVPRYTALYPLMPMPDGLSEQAQARFEVERHQALAELCRRLAHTVKNNTLGGPWAHESIHTTSDREGVTDIMEELAIKGASPQAQYIDCDIPDLDKAARELNLHDSLYELKDGRWSNRGWSDRSLYYYRVKAERLQTFHTLMEAVATLPIELVRRHFQGHQSDFQRTYRESIRACSPGPVRRLVGGVWQNLPLTGAEAEAHLMAAGMGPVPFHPRIAYHRGETWHKSFLDREQKTTLDQAIAIRCQPYAERLNDHIQAEQTPDAGLVAPIQGIDVDALIAQLARTL